MSGKKEKASVLLTVLFLALPVAFIYMFFFYLMMEEPLELTAAKPLSFPLKLEYLEKPIKVGYRLNAFSGEPKKVTVYFSFYDRNRKPISRLTYVLSGAEDHWNYSNKVVSQFSYITFIKDCNTISKKYSVVFENIVKDLNTGAKKIGASKTEPGAISAVEVNLQAWYDSSKGKSGDVSATFYSWDRYVLE